MSFAKFNRPWVDNFLSIKDAIKNRDSIQNVKNFLKNYDARYLTFPMPLVIEQAVYEELCQASKLLIQAQTKILKFLLSTHSQDHILEMFDLPKEAKSFIDWDELGTGNNIISRPDIIPSNQGYKFCELNIECSLGGIKFFDCFSGYFNAIGGDSSRYLSPRKVIAEHLHELVLEHKFERVVIFSLKQYLLEGSGAVKSLFDSVTETISEVPVSLVTEEDYPEEYLDSNEGKKTLIYRLALYDDLNCYSLFSKIFASGATVINTFETEIRSNKKWFALFHDQQYHSILSEAERETILKYTPYTISISQDNIENLIENKNNFIFKANRSYGGESIYVGMECEADSLRESLKNLKGGTAQEYIVCETLDLPDNDEFELKQNKIVLGLFQILDQFTGLVVRGSLEDSIVNVTHGAKVGWAFPISLEERETLMLTVNKKFSL
ncbi:hypothetical protein [Legionella drozanskii]|uniref:Uncharacterized protein n=1 Tax=Legionella drozanskii LLAP-1 TaxID=1212489 RepID=A0A0W0SYX9_9GAMM|nr:hypothetical protein [Legionella drozanskii]KTC88165.1 hypothetical protein Ldro_1784 [Legionella drozanskii LLAP-1]